MEPTKRGRPKNPNGPNNDYRIKAHERMLSGRQAVYVETVIKTGSKAAAKRAAGYSAQTGTQSIEKVPAVHKALSVAATHAIEVLKYTAEDAHREAGEAMQFAMETGNANALVKAVELRAKIHGLVDKMSVPQLAQFQVVIQGIEGTPAVQVIAEIPHPPKSDNSENDNSDNSENDNSDNSENDENDNSENDENDNSENDENDNSDNSENDEKVLEVNDENDEKVLEVNDENDEKVLEDNAEPNEESFLADPESAQKSMWDDEKPNAENLIDENLLDENLLDENLLDENLIDEDAGDLLG